MPDRKKADLIIHPERLLVLQTLAGKPMTTQEIAEALPALPKPSLYRHLKLLLDGNMLEVVETRQVRGIQEKVYRISQATHLTAEDLAGFNPQEHFRYFSIYLASLLKGFADYLGSGEHPVNMLVDRAGYSATVINANDEELIAFKMELDHALQKLIGNPPRADRHRHKIAVITHPLYRKERQNGNNS